MVLPAAFGPSGNALAQVGVGAVPQGRSGQAVSVATAAAVVSADVEGARSAASVALAEVVQTLLFAFAALAVVFLFACEKVSRPVSGGAFFDAYAARAERRPFAVA